MYDYIDKRLVEQKLNDQNVHWDSLVFYDAGECAIFITSDKAAGRKKFTIQSSCDEGSSLTQVAQTATRVKANQVVVEALAQANKMRMKILASVFTEESFNSLPKSMQEIKLDQMRAESLEFFSRSYAMSFLGGDHMEDPPDLRQGLIEDDANENMLDAMLEEGYERGLLLKTMTVFKLSDISAGRSVRLREVV